MPKKRQIDSPSREAEEILRALKRAARNALELGIKTGTPVYVIKNNKIVDLTKEHGSSKRAQKTKKNLRQKKAGKA